MNRDCVTFRRLLERALAGPPRPPELLQLGWHEHVLWCSGCRELLEAEEALEILLASLPDPQLPPDLVRRLVARLHTAGDELDSLLALDHEPSVPAGLAERVLAGVATSADRLDELLDEAGEVEVPAGLSAKVLARLRARRDERRLDVLLEKAGRVRVPAGLADRVLARVEAARGAEVAAGRRAAFRSVPPAAWRAAAAVLVASLLALGAWRLRGTESDTDVAHIDGTAAPLPGERPSDAFLATLPVLEQWEVLQEVDEIELDAVTHMDDIEQALLDWENENG